MYLPRNLISHLYLHLLKTHHPLSPPVLILVALEPDALCACRILTSLLKRDYIPHKIHPIAGYGDLARAGEKLIRPMRLADGGNGGVVACLGVGGLVDLEGLLGLEVDEEGNGGLDGVDIWVFDSRRPWNLNNIFGGSTTLKPGLETDQVHLKKNPGAEQGQISPAYQPGSGGVVVFDDGDIQEELGAEKEAWYALEAMPDIGDAEDSDTSSSSDHDRDLGSPDSSHRKRKSWSDREEEENSESEKENTRPRQRRRSSSSTQIHSSGSSPRQPRSPLAPREKPDLFQSTPPSNQQSSPPPAPPAQPSARTLRRRLLRLRRKYNAILRTYQSLGTSYSEPISSLMYSLASELGREDNDLLWLSIVGVSSTELYGHTSAGVSLTSLNHSRPTFNGWTGSRGSRIRHILRDEVRRLNPPELTETGREVSRGHATDVIPTHARSPTDTSIRLSPEPRFLLIRHWSLYDSMLHSPYLSAKLHIWSDAGRRRLHKLLAKMGVSLTQCKQSYTHMDIDLKKDLRQKLLQIAPVYGLDGLVPPPSTTHGGGDKEGWGFVRSWGWKTCLSAVDVAVIIGAVLEVGPQVMALTTANGNNTQALTITNSKTAAEEALVRFYSAYDTLLSPTALTRAIPLAQSLHRAILRTGTSLLQKRQIKHLRAFRMAIVKEGPDVGLFVNPGALTKLALWVGEAIGEVEKDDGKAAKKKGGTPLVLGCLDEGTGVYIVVGMGGGGAVVDGDRRREKNEKKDKRERKAMDRAEKREAKRREREERGDEEEDLETEGEGSSSSSEGSGESSDDDVEAEAQEKQWKGQGTNRFGNAFQEVVEETSARVRLDSFEHCVVEVKKEDLSGFLESLSMKAVVG